MKKIWWLIFPIAFFSCKKSSNFQPVPQVAFSRFVKYTDAGGKDTAVDFVFTIKDGDGDLGVTQNELNTLCSKYTADLFIKYEENKSGNFVQKYGPYECRQDPCDTTIVVCDTFKIEWNISIPYIDPVGNTNSLEAEVTYHMDYITGIFSMSPAGRFRFYFKDRAGHLSNEVVTPELDVNK
jgi:hypothetical protein